jgi:hypothetical protein
MLSGSLSGSAAAVLLKRAGIRRLATTLLEVIEMAENPGEQVRQILGNEARAKYGGRRTVHPHCCCGGEERLHPLR